MGSGEKKKEEAIKEPDGYMLRNSGCRNKTKNRRRKPSFLLVICAAFCTFQMF
jgi:hypothetical protein